MSELMVKVEDVYKEYRLGAIGGTTLRDEIKRKVAKTLHKEDPTKKIGQENVNIGEKFLALSGVSFEVKKGEALGIIGHNGAGKSTMLKLITRITAPTMGNIFLNGRVASMLEVGTGFHPELTGRENVYLNGAILGMTKKEIDAKMEEIIEFSEVRQFIDTPVKRYSSGMYVKLAFSVAAHLDSEIMIMDEVLAVGDVAFQNKCIKKMREVADSGRTVLYVSHNMNTIRKLCNKCIVLDKGKLVYTGDVEKAVAVYMNRSVSVEKNPVDLSVAPRYGESTGVIKMLSAEFKEKENTGFTFGEKTVMRLSWESSKTIEELRLRVHIKSADSTSIGVMYGEPIKSTKGNNSGSFLIDFSELVPGQYSATMILYESDSQGVELRHECVEPAFSFEITSGKSNQLFFDWNAGWGTICFNKIQTIGLN